MRFSYFRKTFLGLLLLLIGRSIITGMASTTDDAIQDILQKIQMMHQSVQAQRKEQKLPIVTVSFAQSLDGKLAPFQESSDTETIGNYPLSGSESLKMTHAIRAMHNGILIGGKTLALDNPRLNNRLWQLGGSEQRQPIPIALDTNLNHLRALQGTVKAQQLIVCCSEEAASSLESLPAAVVLCPCPCGPDGRIDLKAALNKLYHRHGIQTLMVEGGAQVISSVVQDGLVDVLCITIAPKVLSRGIAITYGRSALDLAETSVAYQLGDDSIRLASLRPTSADIDT
jgi:riboflavin-specific deaminase-like protein